MITSLLGFLHATIQLALYVSSSNSLQYNYIYKKLQSMWRSFYHVSETRKLFVIDNLHPPEHPMTNLIEMTNKIQLCRKIYYSIVP